MDKNRKREAKNKMKVTIPITSDEDMFEILNYLTKINRR